MYSNMSNIHTYIYIYICMYFSWSMIQFQEARSSISDSSYCTFYNWAGTDNQIKFSGTKRHPLFFKQVNVENYFKKWVFKLCTAA
jgi:hypothetical protein